MTVYEHSNKTFLNFIRVSILSFSVKHQTIYLIAILETEYHYLDKSSHTNGIIL